MNTKPVNSAQIQIHFTAHDDWSRYTLTALAAEQDGYSPRKTYRSRELPAADRATLQGIIDSLTGLNAPWRAVHVVAELHEVKPEPESTTPFEPFEAVLLTVNARRKADNAPGTFTAKDIPQLCLMDEAAIGLFKNYTTSAATAV